MPRPFRFGVILPSAAEPMKWSAKCRRAEELGYDVILAPDHLGLTAPFPALVAAAAATCRPRLGTFVLNAGFWNPVLLAREVMTVHTLTGERLELGLGAGYIPAEHAAAGLPWGSPRERVDHVRCTVEELKRLDSMKYRQPEVPLLIGGNGDGMLRLAAEYADVAAFLGARALPDGVLEPLTPEELDERVARFQQFADARAEPAELNLLIQVVVVTDGSKPSLRRRPPRMPRHLTKQQILDLPITLAGSLKQVVEQVQKQRERYGISYLTMLEPNMEAFAPILEALHGK